MCRIVLTGHGGCNDPRINYLINRQRVGQLIKNKVEWIRYKTLLTQLTFTVVIRCDLTISRNLFFFFLPRFLLLRAASLIHLYWDVIHKGFGGELLIQELVHLLEKVFGGFSKDLPPGTSPEFQRGCRGWNGEHVSLVCIT